MVIDINSGASGASAPAQAPAQAPVQSAQVVETSAAPATSEASSSSTPLDALREAMNASVEKLMNRGQKGTETRSEGTPLDSSLIGGQPAQAAPAAQAPAPQAAQTTPVPQAQPPQTPQPQGQEPQNPATAQVAEQIKSVRLDKFGRDYSMPEIEQAIEMAAYYHPKVMQIQESVQKLAAEEQRIAALKDSPENILLDSIKNNDTIRAKVMEFISSMDPASLTNYQQTTATTAQNQELAQVKAELEALKQSQAQEVHLAKQENWNRYVDSTRQTVVSAVDQHKAALAQEGIQITDADVESIYLRAQAAVANKQMQFEPNQLTKHFIEGMNAIAGRIRDARTQALQGHIAQKRTLPPPPPTGGAAPVLSPTQPKSFKEASTVMAERLQLALQRV